MATQTENPDIASPHKNTPSTVQLQRKGKKRAAEAIFFSSPIFSNTSPLPIGFD
jgi:hypothetical protein